MRFLRSLWTDLRQLFSWKLAAAILVTGLTYIFAGFSFMYEQADVWYIVGLAVWGSTAYYTIYLLPVFAFSSQIAADWQTHATPYWIIRTGVVRYTVSKMIASAISGFLTHFLGVLILILYFAPSMPLFLQDHTTTIYSLDWMRKGYVIRGFIGFMIDKSIAAALVAALGMMVSVYFIHPYVAIASPIAVLLTLSRLTYKFRFGLFGILNPSYWTNTIDTADSAAEALLAKMILLIVMMTLFTIIGVAGMKRRVAHA